ncbi:MAG: hypothetical protein ABI743_12575 [bacterium]
MRRVGLSPQLLDRLGRFPEQARPIAPDDMADAMIAIRERHATSAQIGALLMGMRIKGMTVIELKAAIEPWLEVVPKLDLVAPALCVAPGLGGQMRTIGLSLPSSLVAAAAGARVCLLGGETMPPHYGITASDILRALGSKTTLQRTELEASLASIGWVYAHVPLMVPSLRRLSSIRKELGIDTLIDAVEQFLSPVGLRFVLISVPTYPMGRVFAEVLRQFGVERATVVLGEENQLDVALDHPSTLWRVQHDQIAEVTFNPREYGLDPIALPGPQGLTLREMARMYEEILSGQPHPYRQAVQMNAALAIYTSGIAADFQDALRRADEALLYGTAYRKLREFRSCFALK